MAVCPPHNCACLLLVLAAVTITVTTGQNSAIVFPGVREEDCTVGRCLPADECHLSLSVAKICGLQDQTLYVCCPAKPQEPENTSGSNTVSSPVIDFECGHLASRSPPPDHPRAARSLGGVAVSPTTSWPWVALVGIRDENGQNAQWRCVGSLVHPQWVLTALHCFFSELFNVVRLDEHDFSDPDDGALHHDIEIADVVFHPNHVNSENYNDLALLRLAHPVPPRDTIMPVCLPWGSEMLRDLIGRDLTYTGWGDTQFGGMRSPVLMELNMTLFPSQTCDESYSTLLSYINYPRGIDDSFLCLGHPDGG
ncbi:venom protease-like isoform X2 [Eriocheir sinensis]|nr:venom protease-like isoform X2 [Eriocheir sinensis]